MEQVVMDPKSGDRVKYVKGKHSTLIDQCGTVTRVYIRHQDDKRYAVVLFDRLNKKYPVWIGSLESVT